MKREIVISGRTRDTRVAILDDELLVEILVDHPDRQRTVGDIHLGRVEAVLPGLQAAFVDIGQEKAAFLHASDLIDLDEDDDESNGRNNRARRSMPNIADHVKRGEEVLVQVTKEPISTKGPRVTKQVSLPGRFMVYMPFASRIGVSRKIADPSERARLRSMVKKARPDDSGGIIVRTVAEDLTPETCKREVEYLLAQWRKIQRKRQGVRAPALVHREANLTRGVIRDLFSDKVDSLVVDTRDLFSEIRQYLKQVDPELRERVRLYRGKESLFDKMKIEEEIARLFKRRVNLPGGGYLVIEPTEALVSIDINTGSYVGKKDAERTILTTNLEAAREIARQLRLRDMGGIIVIDYIDMENQKNRDRLATQFRAHLQRDRARTRSFGVSDLGLLEMTRQRVRPSLYHSMTSICPTCNGTGRVFLPDTVVRHLERSLHRVATENTRASNGGERRLAVRVHPAVALYLLEEEPKLVPRLRRETRIELEIRDDPTMRLDEFKLMAEPAGRDVTERYAVA